jgi:hypothetical protein
MTDPKEIDVLTHPIIEHLELPARGLTHATVLRAFDILRRRVAIEACGAEGVFTGFDSLRLSDPPECPAGRVLFSALLLEPASRRHCVGYEATYICDHFPGACRSFESTVFASGEGHTVAVGRTQPDGPHGADPACHRDDGHTQAIDRAAAPEPAVVVPR